MSIHVYPLNDWLPHDTETNEPSCHCNPAVEWIDHDTGLPHDEPIITHNAFDDGRE